MTSHLTSPRCFFGLGEFGGLLFGCVSFNSITERGKQQAYLPLTSLKAAWYMSLSFS